MADPLPVAIIRGGTSRGVFTRGAALADRSLDPDTAALRLTGAEDPDCVDGLGGARPTTSKVVLVDHADDDAQAEVRFTVGNLSPGSNTVDWRGTCGNLTAAVPLYAVVDGLVSPDVRTVRMRNSSTGGLIVAEIDDGRPDGLDPIGVTTTFLQPSGSVFRATLPLGEPISEFRSGGMTVRASVVDIAHPYLILRSEDVTGSTSSPRASDISSELLAELERLRGRVAQALGVVADGRSAPTRSPAVPRTLIVGNGDDEAELTVLAISMGRVIETVPMSAAMCLAAARHLAGTVPHAIAGTERSTSIVIRGANGLVRADADVSPAGEVISTAIARTARVILRGAVTL